MPRRGSKYAALADDPVVKRWLKNLRRGSPVTADVSLRHLGKACELLGATPQELLKRAKRAPGRFQDSLEDLVDDLEAKRKSPGYIIALLKPIRSLLKYHGVILTRTIKITNSARPREARDPWLPYMREALAAPLRNSRQARKSILALPRRRIFRHTR